MTGQLFIVATPIGNLGDITARALETLRTVDLVLCEDTRVTLNLLNHFVIKTPTKSYHQHSDAKKIQEIRDILAEGKNIALVTDAGTPGISDPGNYLVDQITDNTRLRSEELRRGGEKQKTDNKGLAMAEAREIVVTPIPGPSAVIAALSISGFPTDKFLFLGFPPHKKGRQTFFKTVAASEYTTVFYESNHRIEKCLTELAVVLPETKKICVCRELTKKFETIYRGTISEIMNKKIPAKGEFVVVISSD